MTPTPWPAFAGIDWGGEHHQLCVVDNAGKRLTQRRVAHDVAGLADLRRELARFGEEMPIAIERSEGLLVEHLQAYGHVLFAVSPRIAARARERYKVASVKDDRFDAFVLADTLRHEHERWRPLSIPSPLLAEIKALTRDRNPIIPSSCVSRADSRSQRPSTQTRCLRFAPLKMSAICRFRRGAICSPKGSAIARQQLPAV